MVTHDNCDIAAGKTCPFCLGPLEQRRVAGPRQGGRRTYYFCAADDAAWEGEPPAPRSARAEQAPRAA